jgi:hypothetical protein
MTARKTPVANLRQTRRELAAAKAAHPAGKKVAPAAKPAAKAPAKAPKPDEAQKVTYSAQSRSGKTNSRSSTTPLVAAVDCKIANRKGAQFASGVIVGFYHTEAAAQKVVDAINGGGGDWSDAVIVPVAVSA